MMSGFIESERANEEERNLSKVQADTVKRYKTETTSTKPLFPVYNQSQFCQEGNDGDVTTVAYTNMRERKKSNVKLCGMD